MKFVHAIELLLKYKPMKFVKVPLQKNTGWFSGPDTIGYLNQHVYASLNIHL
jgi:hypothetical protein